MNAKEEMTRVIHSVQRHVMSWSATIQPPAMGAMTGATLC